MDTMRTMTGLEVRLYPSQVQFWNDRGLVLSMSPEEYGEVHRWIEATLHTKAALSE